MKVWAMWYGGVNYSVPELADAQEFNSISEALNDFVAKYRNEDGQTPNVTNGAESLLYFADPRGAIDPYPDRIIKIGPRGGWIIERC